MLTKIQSASDPAAQSLDAAKRGISLDSLAHSFGDRLTNIRPIPGGTFGFALLADLDGRPSFLKTNALPAGAQTLAQEFAVLDHLYGSTIHLQKIRAQDGRLWMLMDELSYPKIKLTPAQVLALSESLSDKLQDFDAHQLPQPLLDFNWILQAGHAALGHLASHDMLAPTIQREAADHLSLIATCPDRAPPALCHGDLGPLNIMAHNTIPTAIDWEDSFRGFRGYDYLYWLTFFENRKHYSADILGHTSLGKPTEIGIMILILIIKSDISFKTQKYKENKISFNQRIEELLALS